ncbi:helix-turn-helix domain-containing protein [Streptomyces sp. NPDC006551]|uniref:MmyB family transcriptional regulator n=1 Tax=Streptomyces sp. NPDC006551 TaxID=3157178 RepID=UPI0033A91A1B
MNKKALQNLLRERRDLIDPEALGLTRRKAGSGRRAPGLSQQQIDELTNRAQGTYNRLETGAMSNPTIGYLEQVARLLGLNEQEWVALCRYSGIGDPPGPLNQASGLEVPGVWKEAVEGIGHMAYVTDASWNLVTYNQQWVDLFPGRRIPRNTMRWMLLDQDARITLTDWKTAWAPLVLPQLRAGLALRPNDETLRQIEKEVRADPDLGPLWANPGAHMHPDGDERPLNHALEGPGYVTMCAAQPLTAPGARLIILLWHPGTKKVHTRTPMLHALDI